MPSLKRIKKQRGLTLIEVLATVVILSIVLIATFSILQSSTKQSNDQQKDANQLRTSTLFLKIITKDFRSSIDFEVISADELILKGNYSNTIYKLINNGSEKKIVKDGELVADKIGCLHFKKDNNQLNIYVSANSSVTNCTSTSKDILSTQLLLRKGN